MDKFNFLTVAIKNLRRKTFRTGALVFSIALLVCLMIFALSFVVSVSSGIKRTSDRFGADLLVVPVGARSNAEEFLLESKEAAFYMPKSIIDRVRKIEGIENLTYQTYLTTISGLCCDIAPTRIIAFNQESDFIVNPWLQKSLGRKLKRGEAIAGYETDYNLGFELLDVEKTIFNNKFKIVGVLDKTGTGLDNALFMDEENLNDIIASGKSPLKTGEISIIFAKLKKGLDPYLVGKKVEADIVEVDVVSRREMGGSLLNALKDINKIFLVSISMASVLAVFLVWAIFSAIANERSREVGIMRAIGAKESHIVRLFMLEVFIIAMMGSIIGIAAGVSLSASLSRSFTILKDIAASLSLIQHAVIAIAGLLVGFAVCVVGAMLPVNRIKKLEPLLAIKKE